jgi:hypothetical protein
MHASSEAVRDKLLTIFIYCLGVFRNCPLGNVIGFLLIHRIELITSSEFLLLPVRRITAACLKHYYSVDRSFYGLYQSAIFHPSSVRQSAACGISYLETQTIINFDCNTKCAAIHQHCRVVMHAYCLAPLHEE